MCSTLLIAASVEVACFIGYDSRWGEAKHAQMNAAEASRPASIRATEDDGSRSESTIRTLRVRVRPDDHYLAQTVDAARQIADLIEDANRVLVPTVGVRLDATRLQRWILEGDGSLEVSIRALQTEDDGDGVDFVVGMVGSLARATDDLHQVGIANLWGKYLVVRAAGRIEEDVSIDRAFDQLSDADRSELLHVRKRHRALAVFLHELGHCLGALHERSPTSIMHSTYGAKMNGFGRGGAILLRAALSEAPNRLAVARAQLAILRDETNDDWVVDERRNQIERLTTFVASETLAVRPALAVSGELVSPVVVGLDAEANERLKRATALLRDRSVQRAYEVASPLFELYPSSYAVQDLRCQLALVRFLERDEFVKECAPLSRLANKADAGTD